MFNNRDEKAGVNWGQVNIFIAITFVLSWGLNLILALIGGYGSGATLGMLQLQMLVPALAAIFLGMFVFKNSPLFVQVNRSAARWLFYAYLLFAFAFTAIVVMTVLQPDTAPALESLKLVLYLVFAVLALVFSWKSGSVARARTGLSGGKFKAWIAVFLAFTLYYALQAVLNLVFGLAVRPDHSAVMEQVGISNPVLFMLPLILQNGLVLPLLGIVLAFGEEYGWRFYLQNELIKLGKKRGILLLGIIWAVWHYPAIWLGHNYPGQPVAGTVLMTIFTVLAAYIFGYIVLKTGSIWLAAFAHGVNNQIYATFAGLLGMPNDPILSFGPGIFGLVMMAGVVLLILRDPVWQDGSVVPDFGVREAVLGD